MVAKVASAECVDGIFVITDGFVGEKEYKVRRCLLHQRWLIRLASRKRETL